ncbi:O-Glycosyl hydrolase family 30 [Arcticibacter svalbardensis MN12-7]|uniref:O-Glycosyl hydrolase family 30 n=2 Tax=Arcticibacter TaxID=1288026 RepID=R9GQT4_9SPHI|nr:O-Glycosyl hydrolase family 30 [Arcticibacter svalbardensis MN12-7]
MLLKTASLFCGLLLCMSAFGVSKSKVKDKVKDKVQDIEQIYSTPTKHWVELKKPTASINKNQVKADIVIYSDSLLQKIDGFGGAFNEMGWTSLKTIPDAEAKKVIESLFSKEGCNLSMGRMPIGASDYALSYYSFDDVPEDFVMRDFNIDRDKFILMAYIKEALKVRPDMKLWGSPWTPPAWMKVNEHYSMRNGDLNGRTGGNRMTDGAQILNNATAFKMQERYLKAYALYFSKFVKAYKAEGVNVYAIMPQNEIAYTPNWPACTWRPEDLAYFIKDFMGPQMEKDSLGTEIWLGTINYANPNYVKTILDDKKAAKYIKGVGFQWAGSKCIPTISKDYPQYNFMQTENICGEGENNWTSLQRSWGTMIHYFNNGVSSYMYWNMILDENGMSAWGWPQNSMVVIDKNEKTVKYTDEFYLFKHFSHFVQPGDHLLKSSTGENHIAFKLKDGRVLLLINNPKETEESLNVQVGAKSLNVKLLPTSINSFVLRN